MTFEEFLAGTLPEPHTVTVEAYRGAAGYGDAYGPETTVTPCYVEAKRRMVRAPDGSQVVSGTTVYAPVNTACPPRSRVTLHDGTVTQAITTTTYTAAGLPLPEHVEINCE